MPIKSLRQRTKKAKREGVPVAIHDGDFRPAAKSKHAAKKSRGIRARATLEARHVSRKKAPGEGESTRSQADFPRPSGEPRPSKRARRRMAGTDLRAPKIGSERPFEVPF